MSLVEEVKEYALEHYDDGGWDVVIETMTNEDIAKDLVMIGLDEDKEAWCKPCTTLEEATTKSLLATLVSIWADRQADAKNSAF